ncbi:hypothetical protein GOD90_10495 [Sinorhizobium medicae]|nr:hypothetical protein [Sinorhizobium medicae]
MTEEQVIAERVRVKAEIAALIALEVESLMAGGDASKMAEISRLRHKYSMLEAVSNHLAMAALSSEDRS